ncbi:MAG: radical SAM protein [Candidatus Woesearchaeota archaeon]|jgi:MoaA/NifB/PqqE/SkfB family radical SAM enzyme
MIQKSKKEYFKKGQVPIGVGAVLKGWDLSEEEYRSSDKLPIVDFRAMTNACLHDCFFCFTDKNKKTLTVNEIKNIIDRLADNKTHAINYLGEGEPTLDKDFFEIIKYTSIKGIHSIIFTDGATRLRDREFVKRLYDLDTSILPKCDSLFDAKYQNFVVGDKKNDFFNKRNEAIDILISQGFNKIQDDGTTRLGFDMVVSSKNIYEVENTLRYCRDNNLWIMFAFYLPAGRSTKDKLDESFIVSEKDKVKMRELVSKIDSEYGFEHEMFNNFATTPCMEFMQIYGDGRVSPCPGNETIIGNIMLDSVAELERRILDKFPDHNRQIFKGHCLYRESL